MSDDDWYVREHDWVVRELNSSFDPAAEYDQYPFCFTLQFHHGGKFSEFPEIKYEDGKITYIDKVNTNLFTVITLNDMLIELGYSEDDIVTYHFKVPGEEDLDLGLRPLGNDQDVNRLLGYAEKTKVLEVYVEHIRTHSNESDDLDTGEVTQEARFVEGFNVTEGSENEGIENEGSEESYESSESSENEGSKHDSEDDDPDYMVDEDNTVEDYKVDDMEEFRAMVDFEGKEDGEENERDYEDAPENEVDGDDFDSLSDSDDTPYNNSYT